MGHDGRRRIAAVVGALAAAVVPALLIAPHTASAANGCDPVWTDPTGDAYTQVPFQGSPVYAGFYQPQLDLTGGTFWQSGSNLVVRIHVADMEPQLPPGKGGESWASDWQIGTSTLYVDSLHTLDGDAYAYSVDGRGASASGVMVDGPDGYVEVDVPLAQLGSPARTTTVTFQGADSWDWAGSAVILDPATLPNLAPLVTWNGPLDPSVIGQVVDSAAGGNTTTVGATCP